MQRYMTGFCAIYTVYKQKPDIFRCNGSNRDGLGFHAEIYIIFGLVWQYNFSGYISYGSSSLPGIRKYFCTNLPVHTVQ